MAAVAYQRIIRHVRKVSLARDERQLSDGALLECFLDSRDEAAFAMLVERYGPMVLGVCRRVLRNCHDAEDAFQATFVVLVRKGNTIYPRELVGNWLYGVAYRTSLEARAKASKRRQKERTMQRAEAQSQEPDDLQALIDRELLALPEKYRDPIVLCDLQGKTRQEAARKLGCPEGTIAGRLARGREMLAKRLTRHGIVISAAGLALFFSQNITSAAVPMTLVCATVNSALTGAISAPVAALTEGVLQAMFITKVKLVATYALIFGFLTAGMGLIGHETWVGNSRAAANAVAQDAPKNTQPTLESRWADLASPDDVKATRAVLALSASPKESMALLQERLKPVKADAKRVEQLLKQLDSNNFAVRNQAMNELEYFGKYIKNDLEAALKKEPGVELKMRLLQLLDKMPKEQKAEAPPPMPNGGAGKNVAVENINGQIRVIIDGVPFDPTKIPTPPPPPPGPPSGWVRAVRAVTLLEHLATPETRQLLEAMAAGEADALPTVAAREALQRMKK
jgi:RNA polymerase sigma factor (sigma-70 family)